MANPGGRLGVVGDRGGESAGQQPPRGLRVAGNAPRRVADQERCVPVRGEAFPGKRCCRREKRFPGHGSPSLVRGTDAADEARNGDGQGPIEVPVILHGRPREYTVRNAACERVCRSIKERWRPHPEVEGMHAAGGLANNHEAAAANSTHPGLDHAEGKGDGHGGIDGVAVRRQNIRADSRCLAVLGSRNTPRAGGGPFSRRSAVRESGAPRGCLLWVGAFDRDAAGISAVRCRRGWESTAKAV